MPLVTSTSEASRLLAVLACRYPVDDRWSAYLRASAEHVLRAEMDESPKEVKRLLGVIAYTLTEALRPRRKLDRHALQPDLHACQKWPLWPKG